ncbi:branched-chain amino acid ABC transporter permease [Streptomyces sp. NPDC005708]|uniref:branched-chain amino acid ABC transporter permease n=1 Tax=Streptomyces sp. NPDC005708 TaxID=3154564 RepID=UPI00340998C8
MSFARVHLTWGLLGVLVLVTPPFVTASDYYLQFLTQVMIFAVLFTALDIAVGHAGLVSAAHGALFGLGAYTTGVLGTKLHWGFWTTLPAAVCVGVLCGLLVGALTLKLDGHYFVIATLCFGIVVTIVVRNGGTLTNGDLGLSPIPYPSNLGPLDFSTPKGFYLLTAALAVLASTGAYLLMRTATGQRLRAMRDNAPLASALGVDVSMVRLVAFLVSAGMAAVAGSFQAANLAFISPSITDFDVAVTAVLAVIVGGRSSVAGPYVGAVIFVVLPEVLRSADDYRLIIMGSLLIATIIFAPDGVVGRVKAMVGLLVSRFRTSSVIAKSRGEAA